MRLLAEFKHNIISMNTDITQRRHGGNVQSELAFEEANLSGRLQRDRLEVLNAVRLAGTYGITCKELAHEWGVGMNHVSGRFTELKKEGKIVKIPGVTRQRSAVCKAVSF